MNKQHNRSTEAYSAATVSTASHPKESPDAINIALWQCWQYRTYIPY